MSLLGCGRQQRPIVMGVCRRHLGPDPSAGRNGALRQTGNVPAVGARDRSAGGYQIVPGAGPGPPDAKIFHPPPPPPPPPRPAPPRRPLGCLFEVVEPLVLTVIIFLVIQNFVAQPYRIEQMSMEQTLEPGQYVLIDKLSPRWDDYSRGDIIVFWPPEETHDVPFIKRVIGLPGDRVAIRDGSVYVNGIPLDEPYVFGGPTEPGTQGDVVVVPPDSYFALGDHRSDSTDSRVYGFVARDDVIRPA